MTPHPVSRPAADQPPWLHRGLYALLFALVGAVSTFWLVVVAILIWLWRWARVGSWGAEEWIDDGWKLAILLVGAVGVLVGLYWVAGVIGVPIHSAFVGAPLGAAYGWWLQKRSDGTRTAYADCVRGSEPADERGSNRKD